MKQLRNITGLIIALVFPLLFAGPVFAEPITQELHVTAVVPSHRDIFVDKKGSIVSISSNTREDVMPDVYLNEAHPNNKRPLTPEMYKTYRSLVPVGTAQYGVLYTRPAVQTAASKLNLMEMLAVKDSKISRIGVLANS